MSEKGKRRKIAIVGSGAIGSYYGALLARAGEDVHFLMRSDFAAVKARGLRVEQGDESFTLPDPQIYASTREIGPCDWVIVALKATANEALPDLLAPLVYEETAILTLQNGLGNEAFLGRHFGDDRILGGLCFICVNRLEAGVIKSFYPGYMTVGEYVGGPRERTREIARMWEKAGVRCQLAESLAEARWRKLVWNVPFNGLAIVAGGIDTQAILARPELEKLARALMQEVQAIAAAAGYRIEDAFLDRQFEVTYPMGPYKPSSLIDYELGREVEIEAIWGEAVRQAHALEVEAPRLEMLYQLLCSMAR